MDTEQATAAPKPKAARSLRWVIWMAATVILLGGGVLLSQKGAGSGKTTNGKPGANGRGGGAIPVSVATVQKGNMGDYINTLGTVTSVYTVTLTSRVVGSLAEIHYHEGQIVHKGELLALIDPRPYQAVYLQAEGQLQRDQASLANARIDLDRYRMAFTQHAIPEQTVATQQAIVNQDEGSVKVDQGNLDAARVNVEYTQIRAPINGRVGLRQVDPGNIVQANGTTPILTITQFQPITVVFTMAEDYIADVETQLRSGKTLRVDALSRDNQTELSQGRLAYAGQPGRYNDGNGAGARNLRKSRLQAVSERVCQREAAGENTDGRQHRSERRDTEKQ